jgi:hypothetical protein
MSVKMSVDVTLLFKLWADNGLTKTEIARQVGVTERGLDVLAARHKLPSRGKKHRSHSIIDPTPEEIAERALECRLKHLAAKRLEPIKLKTGVQT